ncbi:MAG: dihydroorotase [Beijerinckiaceae bacterium]|nr:dihydroorotase [Beijerinckiaceae bacterium]
MTDAPLVLINARLFDPSDGRDERGGLLIENGVIAAIGPAVSARSMHGARVHDCQGNVLAPGLIDMRAFMGEPGAEHRETLRTASEAAAVGGVTTIICMPDTTPAIDDPAVVDFLMRRARDTSLVRVHPAAALTKGLQGREMTEIGLLREAGAVAFTDGTRSVTDAQVFRRALTYAAMFGALVIHHVEDPCLVGDGVVNEGEFASRLGLLGVPREAETLMLERDMRLVRLTKGRYHAAVLTCRDSLDILAKAKSEGLTVTGGTSINHLALNENDIGDYRTFLKLAPPLREEDERRAMVEAVADGLIDVIVSDHNPQDVETKRQPFAESANGAVGLETMLSAGLRLVHDGSIPLRRLLHAMSTRPAEIVGLPGGTLTLGAPADLIEIDLEKPWVVDAARLRSRAKNTPFDGARMTGKVMTTIVAGKIVHQYRDV